MENSAGAMDFQCWLSQDKWLKWSGWWGNFSGCANQKREGILQLECRVPRENPSRSYWHQLHVWNQCAVQLPLDKPRTVSLTRAQHLSRCEWQHTEDGSAKSYRRMNPTESFWRMVLYACFLWRLMTKTVVEDHAGAASHSDWNFLVLPYFQQFCWELLSLDAHGKICLVLRIIKVEKWPLRP